MVYLGNLCVDRCKILFELFHHHVELPDVKGRLAHFVLNFADDNEQDVLTELHLLHIVLVVNERNLEVAAVRDFVELVFEVCVQTVHRGAQTVDVVVCAV